jgi:hypothetical protein
MKVWLRIQVDVGGFLPLPEAPGSNGRGKNQQAKHERQEETKIRGS